LTDPAARRTIRGMPRMVLGGLVALLVLAAPAQAATTIGSDLSHSPGLTGACGLLTGRSCTLAGRAASAASPIDGVVVKWRVKTDGSSAFTARPHIVSADTGFAIGDTINVPAAAGTLETPTRLSIRSGQRVAVDVTTTGPTGTAPIIASTGGQTYDLWDPPAGGVPAPPASQSGELLVNADVEPDVDNDGWGDETQDGCPADPSTHGACPPPKQIVNSGSSGSSGSGGSSGGGSSTPVVNPGIAVTAPPPLPTPVVKKAAKKKAKCTRRQRKRHRCPRPKRKRHRR
jgi:hypothetical protein